MTRRRKILDTRYQQLLICWHRKPKQGTPTLMTSAVAYSHFGRAMQGLWIPRTCVRRITLWCSRVFLTAQGRPCFCKALSKARVLTVGDIISPNGDIYAHLLAKVARAFREHYERRLTLMATAIKNGTEVQIPGRTLPELESWSMREFSAGCVAAAEPEGRQPMGVWEAFAKLRLPTGLQDFVRKALWRKLEVSARMLMCHQAPTAVFALCGAREDHHHTLKSCPFLEGGIALARPSWSLRFHKHAWVEPSRICWDLPQLSLSTHVGLFMWAVLFARWKHRCDVVFGRAHPDPSRVLARLHGALGAWAAEHEPSIPRSDILELRRRVSLRLQTQQLCFRTVVGDMPLEAGVPAMQARFQDRGSLIITRNPTRLRAFVLSQPRGYAVLWGGVAKQADATQAAMSPEDQLLRAITWLLMTVPGCAPLTVFCWNATVQNILTSSVQDRLLRPNELMLSKAPREAWGGGLHAQMTGRAVDVFLWSLPETAERSVRDLL